MINLSVLSLYEELKFSFVRKTITSPKFPFRNIHQQAEITILYSPVYYEKSIHIKLFNSEMNLIQENIANYK